MCSRALKCARSDVCGSIQTSDATFRSRCLKNTPAKLQMFLPQIDLIRLGKLSVIQCGMLNPMCQCRLVEQFVLCILEYCKCFCYYVIVCYVKDQKIVRNDGGENVGIQNACNLV